MNIILGQNESLPSSEGSLIALGGWSGPSEEFENGVFKDTGIVDTKIGGGSYTRSCHVTFNTSKTVNKNGSDDPSKWTTVDSAVYKEGAKVTTKNFTYKIWSRKF